MTKILRNAILLSIVVISSFMHLKHINKELISIHVWRQTQTQSTINNFYEEDMNIFNPRRNDRGDTDGIFRMEFPIMQWMVAGLYKIFGNYLIITRLFMFVIGLFSVFGMYKLLYAIFENTTLSVFGAWAFNFSPAFYYYTINPLPDNFSLCCSIWGLALFFNWLSNKKDNYLVISGLLFSFATLSKLPFIVFYIVPVIYFITILIKDVFTSKLIIQVLKMMGFIVFPAFWYIKVIPDWHGNPVVRGMLNNKESFLVLLDYFQHILIITLPEMLLNYGSLLFFLSGFYFVIKRRTYIDLRFVLLFSLCILLLIYYCFEANAISKVHDYYLFPFFPVLFILVGYGAYNLYTSKIKFFRYITFILLLILPLTCYLRMQVRWNPDDPGFNKDLLMYKDELREAVPKDALVVAGNDISHFIFFYYIDKKGWGYDGDKLSSIKLNEMIEKGAEYLYTDSEIISSKNELKPYFDELVLEKGSVKIFRLIQVSSIN